MVAAATAAGPTPRATCAKNKGAGALRSSVSSTSSIRIESFIDSGRKLSWILLWSTTFGRVPASSSWNSSGGCPAVEQPAFNGALDQPDFFCAHLRLAALVFLVLQGENIKHGSHGCAAVRAHRHAELGAGGFRHPMTRKGRGGGAGGLLAQLRDGQRGRVVRYNQGRGYLGLPGLKFSRVPRRLLCLRHALAVDSFTTSWHHHKQLFYRFSAEPVTGRGTDH